MYANLLYFKGIPQARKKTRCRICEKKSTCAKKNVATSRGESLKGRGVRVSPPQGVSKPWKAKRGLLCLRRADLAGSRSKRVF